jgi:hypothetical protein
MKHFSSYRFCLPALQLGGGQCSRIKSGNSAAGEMPFQFVAEFKKKRKKRKKERRKQEEKKTGKKRNRSQHD